MPFEIVQHVLPMAPGSPARAEDLGAMARILPQGRFRGGKAQRLDNTLMENRSVKIVSHVTQNKGPTRRAFVPHETASSKNISHTHPVPQTNRTSLWLDQACRRPAASEDPRQDGGERLIYSFFSALLANNILQINFLQQGLGEFIRR